MTIGEGTALAALVLNIVGVIVGLTWGLAKVRDSVRGEIEGYRKEFDETVAELQVRVGDSIGAIREQMNINELWGRDNYVKKESFGTVTDRISREVRDFAAQINTRLERMESKIDANK